MPSINLILVTADTSASDLHCRHMLDLIFNAMVLLVGLHLLESMSSVEMLKKELKVITGCGKCCQLTCFAGVSLCYFRLHRP